MIKTRNWYNRFMSKSIFITGKSPEVGLRMLKEKGYFYFRPDYILVLVDSNIGGHRVNLYVKLTNHFMFMELR